MLLPAQNLTAQDRRSWAPRDVELDRADERDQRIRELEERLALLSQVSLRVNESLDFDTVLQGVLDSARSLTGARYGAITLVDDSGGLQDFLFSGMTADEARRFEDLPNGTQFLEYLNAVPGPLRVPDLNGHFRAMGLPEFRPPIAEAGPMSFLLAPVLHQGKRVGTFYLSTKEGGQEFIPEDEDTLVMFAAQAAMAIANARRYREERRARASLETLIDISPVGVVVFDATTGAPASFNREAMRIVDRLRGPGQMLVDLLEVVTFRRADGREVSLQEFPLTGLLSAGEKVHAEEIVLRVPDGRSVTVLLNATPILSEDGAVESVVVVMQDLAGVEELERLRAEFLAMVSHELRAPLTSIKGSAATVLESSADLDPAVVRQFFRIIGDQANHMNDLVSDLLDVAGIETGTLAVSPEPAEVAALVDRARNAFGSSGGRNSLTIDLEPDLPLVLADRRRVVQVLGNLLSNAARHSPEGSVIRVSVVREGVHVAVSVSDEGRGIPAERLPHLFRKFTRMPSGEQGGDTGLGLAICKGIVEAHGGRIRAESDGPGLGARFTFTLPTMETSRKRRGVSGRGERVAAEARRGGRAGAGPGGGRRPPGTALRPGRPRPVGIRTGGDRGPAGGGPSDERGTAQAGAAGPGAARHRRHRTDAGHTEDSRRAGDLPVRLRAGRHHRAGLRGGGGGLRGQALLAHGTGGADQGSPAPEGGSRALGTLRAGGPGHRLLLAAGERRGQAGATDGDGVPDTGGAVGQRGAGADLRAPAGKGLEGEDRRRYEPHAHHGQQAQAQAGGRCRQPHLHLHRAPRGLPDAKGDNGGASLGCVVICDTAVRNPEPSFPRRRESKPPLLHSPLRPASPRTGRCVNDS